MPNISLKTVLLNEFNQETATARKLLERVPMEKLDWVPHAKSTPLGKLANHIAQLPGMGATIISKESLSFGDSLPHQDIKTTAELLASFDGVVAATRKELEGATDEQLGESWKLLFKDREIFTGTRFVAFQTILLNHFIHHRAQLGVYLRLNDIAIPGSYGPSADEPM